MQFVLLDGSDFESKCAFLFHMCKSLLVSFISMSKRASVC